MNQILTRMFFRTHADARSAVSKFFTSSRAQCGEVTVGSGEIRRNGKALTITQASRFLCMEWPSFHIEADETVRLQQPNAAAIALIRVTGQDISKIMGQLQADGQVFLINPNGVMFGKHAQVDVTGLVASALGLPDEEFLEGKRTFCGQSDASVTSQGALIAREGGYVALLGHQVKNQGTITANMGSVALVAGSQATLEIRDGHLVDAVVEQAAYAALAENQGRVQADGGHVLMIASTRETPFNTVLRNEGEIQVHTIENRVGSISLLGGEEGITVVSGKLDASAPEAGDGGHIETCGAHVKVMDTARICTTAASGLTGQWLVDPADFTVASAGGDITGAALSAQLNANNVTLQSSQGTVNLNGRGNLYINDEVNWGANTTLTLQAVNDIHINRPINVSGATGGLVLSPGSGRYYLGPEAKVTLSGASPSLTIAGNSYNIIQDINALQNIAYNDYGNHALGVDLDASVTSSWNGGAGFATIAVLHGRFDGLGHTISGLTINRPAETYTGLFGYVNGTVQNVGLINCSVKGRDYVGGLAGFNHGIVNNCFAISSVTGTGFSEGGLIGSNVGLISNCYAEGSVTGTGTEGNTGTFGSHVGGLAGRNDGTIESSYATASVNGQTIKRGAAGGYAGGLTGYSSQALNNCYATGTVSGSEFRGGLTGVVNGTVNASYATGRVDGSGLLGSSYLVGGFAGMNNGTVTNSYWDIQTTGQIRSGGGNPGAIGLTTARCRACQIFCVSGATVKSHSV